MSGETRGNEMPLVTVFNLVKEDRLSEIDAALRKALISLPELKIKDHEIDLVPVLTAEGFPGTVTRINVDLWERPERTKDALQALATSIAKAFQNVAGSDRKVTVVVRPYDVEKSGWVSF
jgi:phenylpyruvate tautomerase PptA (4-oxalocrotonate tautomerase family)